MITDSLKNASKYYSLREEIEHAFNFLKTTNLKTLENKKIIIDGENLWANVQEIQTKAPQDALWEVHRQYIDIQYVITGTERMDWTNIEFFMPQGEFDTNADIQFGEIKENSSHGTLILDEGYFVIYTPDDVHKPALTATSNKNVKKIVVKVKI